MKKVFLRSLASTLPVAAMLMVSAPAMAVAMPDETGVETPAEAHKGLVSIDEITFTDQTETVPVNFAAYTDVLALQMDISLPTGVNVLSTALTRNEDRIESDYYNISMTKQKNGKYRITIVSTDVDAPIVKGSEGMLVSFDLLTTSSFIQPAKMTVSNIVISDVNSTKENQNDFDVTLNPYIGEFYFDNSAITVNATDYTRVAFMLDNGVVDIYGMTADIVLPKGLDLKKNPRGKVQIEKGSRLPNDATVTLNYNEETGEGRLVVSSLSGMDFGKSGEMFAFEVKATESLAINSEIVLSNFDVANKDNVSIKCNVVAKVAVTNQAALDINDNVWAAVQADVEQVQMAIDNFETIVGGMNYASRYEGEEITAPVDAARAWIVATLAEYQAKYEALALTTEDGVKGDALEQVAAVYEALNLAAKYDASRYTFSAVWAWVGNEDEEIEGAKDGVMAVYEILPEENQALFDVVLDRINRETAELLALCEAYTAYNEDNHAEIIALSEALLADIEEAVSNAKQATLEMAMMAIENQVAQVTEAINNFDTIVASMNYASRYEDEEITGVVDAARVWVEETLAAATAKYEAGELTMEDGVMGDALAHAAAVYEALNLAAKYDAGRYTMAASNAWFGNEDEEIEGAKDGVMAICAELGTEAKAAINEQIEALESAINDMWSEFNVYSLYNEDTHATFVAQYEAIIAQIAAIQEAAQAAWEDIQVKPGDINLDGKVNMVDLTTLVNIVLEKIELPEVGTERFLAADANRDGNVDVVDYTAILNIILGKASAPAKVRAMETSDESVDFAVVGNELRISLDNFNAYTAMQFDIALPANVAIKGAESTVRTQGMTIEFNKLANGMTRVVIYSASNETICGINGDIAVLALSSHTQNVAVTNVIAADANANGHALMGAGNVTAINGVACGANGNSAVYDLNGRAMQNVKNGVNIVRNANGETNKVVVK